MPFLEWPLDELEFPSCEDREEGLEDDTERPERG